MWWESGGDTRAEEGCVRGTEENRGLFGSIQRVWWVWQERRGRREENIIRL